MAGNGEDSASLTNPVGEGDYVVKQGDCISSIAREAGHFWQTIWNDPANAQLKQVRKNPNILLPGDRVMVPPLRLREESGQTEQRHKFRRKGIPEFLRLRLLTENDEPVASQPYCLEIDGQLIDGRTGDDGEIEIPIQPNAKRGKLILTQMGEEYDLMLGEMDPIDSLGGVQARLENLGFDTGGEEACAEETTRQALRNFQERYGLPVTGEPDPSTRNKLNELHGS